MQEMYCVTQIFVIYILYSHSDFCVISISHTLLVCYNSMYLNFFDADFEYLCALLNSNGTSCMSDFNSLDVDDQANNPAGMFNATMLRIQAGQQPYVVTDFVNMDGGNSGLFMSLLPNHDLSSLNFTNGMYQYVMVYSYGLW